MTRRGVVPSRSSLFTVPGLTREDSEVVTGSDERIDKTSQFSVKNRPFSGRQMRVLPENANSQDSVSVRSAPVESFIGESFRSHDIECENKSDHVTYSDDDVII